MVPSTEEERNELIRKRHSALPEITKNTVVTRREIDLSLIAEDPVFGDFRKKNIPRRLIEEDVSQMFKSVLSPSLPNKLKTAHSVMPKLGKLLTPGPDRLPSVQTQNLVAKPEPEAKRDTADMEKEETKDDVDAAQKLFNPQSQVKVITKVDDTAVKQKQKEIDKLKALIEQNKKNAKIELQHAKQKAVENAERLIKQKLDKCRLIYEQEFEHLVDQLEDTLKELAELRAENEKNRRIIFNQELIITQIQNTVHAVGWEKLKHDEERDTHRLIEGEKQDEHLQFVVDLQEDPNAYPEELVEHIKTADIMLAEPFNFYNFGVRLNIEEQIDIANRSYIRYYKKKINDLLNDKETMLSELETSNSMVDDFKVGFERSERKIKQLEIQDAMFKEEKKSIEKLNKQRVMRMSNQFIELYKDLHVKFNRYKEYCVYEFENHEQIRTELEKVIASRESKITALQETLSLPREHFKFIENKTADEIVK